MLGQILPIKSDSHMSNNTHKIEDAHCWLSKRTKRTKQMKLRSVKGPAPDSLLIVPYQHEMSTVAIVSASTWSSTRRFTFLHPLAQSGCLIAQHGQVLEIHSHVKRRLQLLPSLYRIEKNYGPYSQTSSVRCRRGTSFLFCPASIGRIDVWASL